MVLPAPSASQSPWSQTVTPASGFPPGRGRCLRDKRKRLRGQADKGLQLVPQPPGAFMNKVFLCCCFFFLSMIFKWPIRAIQSPAYNLSKLSVALTQRPRSPVPGPNGLSLNPESKLLKPLCASVSLSIKWTPWNLCPRTVTR